MFRKLIVIAALCFAPLAVLAVPAGATPPKPLVVAPANGCAYADHNAYVACAWGRGSTAEVTSTGVPMASSGRGGSAEAINNLNNTFAYSSNGEPLSL
jgi:hypothetical protein